MLIYQKKRQKEVNFFENFLNICFDGQEIEKTHFLNTKVRWMNWLFGSSILWCMTTISVNLKSLKFHPPFDILQKI